MTIGGTLLSLVEQARVVFNASLVDRVVVQTATTAPGAFDQDVTTWTDDPGGPHPALVQLSSGQAGVFRGALLAGEQVEVTEAVAKMRLDAPVDRDQQLRVVSSADPRLVGTLWHVDELEQQGLAVGRLCRLTRAGHHART